MSLLNLSVPRKSTGYSHSFASSQRLPDLGFTLGRILCKAWSLAAQGKRVPGALGAWGTWEPTSLSPRRAQVVLVSAPQAWQGVLEPRLHLFSPRSFLWRCHPTPPATSPVCPRMGGRGPSEQGVPPPLACDFRVEIRALCQGTHFFQPCPLAPEQVVHL